MKYRCHLISVTKWLTFAKAHMNTYQELQNVFYTPSELKQLEF